MMYLNVERNMPAKPSAVIDTRVIYCGDNLETRIASGSHQFFIASAASAANQAAIANIGEAALALSGAELDEIVIEAIAGEMR